MTAQTPRSWEAWPRRWPAKAPCSVLVISPEAALGEGINEAVLARTTPAWHPEPAATL